MDYATLVSWAFVVEGDNAGNALEGTNVGDRLYGYDGDDVMESGDGEDVLLVVWVTMSCWVACSATPTWSTWAMART
ncbi:MAG: hypothetical protein IPK48_06130 [Gammaproteobacteria bacterium]|nr:hypothetical protein [Gammaproteobacteria bacterium]